MPVYEFSCKACGARFSHFVRSVTSEVNAACDRCGSADVARLVSRFAVGRAPFDPRKLNKQELLDGVDYSNPASMAQFFRKMKGEFQDEDNDHMDEIIGRLDHGEAVDKALDIDLQHDHDHGDTVLGEADG
jgi:putative FmdB family regulatory protein